MSTQFDARWVSGRFPRASRYHPDWVMAGMGSASNALWLTEWLSEGLELRPGMRVLDLGCGRAISSIFLRREFGVEVWAADLWFNPTENLERIRDAGVADGVYPLHVDARSLPFAANFFDVIVAIDSYMYFGTDEFFLHSLARFVKPGGQVAFVVSGLTQEFDGDVPEHLQAWWAQDQIAGFHSAEWWRRHCQGPGILDVERADTLQDGWRYWLSSLRMVAPENTGEIAALEADQGRYIGYVRVTGRRRADVPVHEPIVSIPYQYAKHPLLRDSD